jgi:hypothetical protein
MMIVSGAIAEGNDTVILAAQDMCASVNLPGACLRVVTAFNPLQYEERVRLLHTRSLLIAGQGNATFSAFGVAMKAPASSAASRRVYLVCHHREILRKPCWS